MPCSQREGNNSPGLHATLLSKKGLQRDTEERVLQRDFDLELGNGRLLSA
jgi:hypothetical protein